MAIRPRINVICLDYLGTSAEEPSDPVWREMNKLVDRLNGINPLVEKFHKWAYSTPHLSTIKRPVTAFLRHYQSLPPGEQIPILDDPAARAVAEIAYISAKRVVPSGKPMAEIRQVMMALNSTQEEVIEEFRSFWAGLNPDNPWSMRTAESVFAETLAPRIYATRKLAEDAKKRTADV